MSEYRTQLKERVEALLKARGESLDAAAGALARVLEGEAAGQDVAGNGHVASAEESTAAGSSRGAPPAPVSSAPAPSSPAAPRRWWLNVYPKGEPVVWSTEEMARRWCAAVLEVEVAVPVIEASAYDAACREREEMLDEWRLALEREDALQARLATAERERDEARKLLAAARGWRRVTREEVARAALALDGHWITDDGMSGAVRVIRALGLEVDDA